MQGMECRVRSQAIGWPLVGHWLADSERAFATRVDACLCCLSVLLVCAACLCCLSVMTAGHGAALMHHYLHHDRSLAGRRTD